ncbi:MAG: hypothetical protein KAS32_20795 [Candidatus Peribacteraceae bacterium]|nr:hypothetical protein [Candidatus Peribacteraceae bacterium]
MSDLIIKKAILAGLGALSLTRGKAEEIAKDLIKQGELAKTGEAKFVKDLMGWAEESKVAVEKKVEVVVKKVLPKLDVPTRKEFNELKAKVASLVGKKR